MVNNLIFRWPKPRFFMVLGAHGINKNTFGETSAVPPIPPGPRTSTISAKNVTETERKSRRLQDKKSLENGMDAGFFGKKIARNHGNRKAMKKWSYCMLNSNLPLGAVWSLRDGVFWNPFIIHSAPRKEDPQYIEVWNPRCAARNLGG